MHLVVNIYFLWGTASDTEGQDSIPPNGSYLMSLSSVIPLTLNASIILDIRYDIDLSDLLTKLSKNLRFSAVVFIDILDSFFIPEYSPKCIGNDSQI